MEKPFSGEDQGKRYFHCINTIPDYAFFKELTPKTRNSWRRVSKDASLQVDMFQKKFNNIIKYLSFFFKTERCAGWRSAAETTAIMFRFALKDANAIVIGTLATNFIDCSSYGPDAAMDIVAGHRGVQKLKTWAADHDFVELESVEPPDAQSDSFICFNKPPPWTPWGESCVRQIHVLQHSRSRHRIHIYECDGPPIEALIQSPLSSGMNLFDYEAAYALFPTTTFEEQRSILNRSETVESNVTAQKALAQGWHVVNAIPEAHAQNKQSEWWEGIRFVGDHKTLRLFLHPPMPDSEKYLGLVRANGWQMRYIYRGGLRLNIVYESLQCTDLAHWYICASMDLADEARKMFDLSESGATVQRSDM
ncbi:hypothetical protein BJ165DRAFT_1535489 [Panaeolus papilionaceus]|nr:hypothetical protein BJ165DRAFT_1535489 [Panaeolus papilionaceus]